MKKWLIAALVILILVIVGVFLFVPSVIEISRTTVTAANTTAVYRKLQDESTWAKAINDSNTNANFAAYKDYKLLVKTGAFDDLSVQVVHGSDTIYSLFKCLSLTFDSTAFKWSTQIITSNNPVTRLRQYFIAKDIPAMFDDVLAKLQSYTSVQANVYGSTITLQMVKDTALMTTKGVYKTYPSSSDVYDLLQKVRNYISGKVQETNSPMMHVQQLSDTAYELMVAIPVSKGLDDNGDIRFKQMIPGRILVTQVTGGQQTVEHTFKMMNLYLIDHRYNQPAIPFASLVTNRLEQPDTTKWVTKIYYPVY